jgi:FlaA1/EpsC-like NDP-sugar epimerase
VTWRVNEIFRRGADVFEVNSTLKQIIRYRRPFVVTAHAVLFVVSFVAAFALRFDFSLPGDESTRLLVTLPWLIALRLGAFWIFHLYEGLWRYVSVKDVLELLKAVTLSSALFVLGVLLVEGHGFPRSVLVLDFILCVGLTGGLRIGTRLILERRPLLQKNGSSNGHKKRAIIVGSDDVAEALLREIGRGALPYTAVGLVDDDRAKRGRRLHGVGVLGGIDDLPAICAARQATEVLIASETASSTDRRRIVEACRVAEVEVRSVPALPDLLQGRAGVGQLHRVRGEELLGREPIGTNLDGLCKGLRGRRILVTGGAGSIGSEIARQVAGCDPEVLVLFDRAESDLYLHYVELRQRFKGVKIEAVVGDILDEARVGQVCKDYSPQLIYHAAAYKHVPLMEAHPIEGIKNNIFGTEIVAKAAIDSGTSEFVLISTDKAVRPVGVMGMTKRAAECVIRSMAGHGTTFVAVRFGNVLGSNGSVLPLFQKQIATGSPLTVTDPDALRYFMLTSEAVELVLQAGALGHDGEVYVLHTGEPIRIGDLAENLIRLSGFEPGLEVPIEITGLRPGERMREELVVEDEDVVLGPHEKILVVREPGFDQAHFLGGLEMLRDVVDAGEEQGSVEVLRALVASDAVRMRSDLAAG